MEVEDIDLLSLQRGQSVPELLGQLLHIVATRSKGIDLGRDIEMDRRQLREKGFRVAITVQSGGIDLDVSVSVEGGEEGTTL